MHLDQLFRVMDQGHEEVHRFYVLVECEDVSGPPALLGEE